jgi:hypothetical protein
VRVVWDVWDFVVALVSWLNVAAVARAFSDVLGSEPITFYQWPEPGEGHDE